MRQAKESLLGTFLYLQDTTPKIRFSRENFKCMEEVRNLFIKMNSSGQLLHELINQESIMKNSVSSFD